MKRTLQFSSMLIAMSVAGCSSTGFVSVEEKFGQPDSRSSTSARKGQPRVSEPKPSGGVHRVEKGDTLYGIAWQYGLDPMALAETNGIRAPFTIYPGQQIAIRNVRRKSSDTSGGSSQVAKPSPSNKPKPQAPVKKPEPIVVAVPPPVAAVPVAKTPTPKPAPATPPKAAEKPEKPVAKPIPAPVSKPPATSTKAPAVGSWKWPAIGKIVAKFSSAEPVNKGIDIAGKAGEPIAAAASGTVVCRTRASGLRQSGDYQAR